MPRAAGSRAGPPDRLTASANAVGDRRPARNAAPRRNASGAAALSHLVRSGYRVLRASWLQVEREPETVALMLAAALDAEPGRQLITHVSLPPPSCDELTTIAPSWSATRVRPPAGTRTPSAVANANGRRST